MKTTVVIVLFILGNVSIVWSAPSTISVQEQFQELVRRGNAQLAEGRLRDAAGQLKAAAGLKPSPSIWLKLVSIYSDIAKNSAKNDDECGNSRLTMESFFSACELCVDPSDSSCRVCLMARNVGTANLAIRTSALAESLQQASQIEAQKVPELEGAEAKRAELKSSGFEAKAKDVARCLSHVHVTSEPSGATIRLNGSSVNVSPVTVTVFAGQHELTAEILGRPLQAKTLRIQGSAERAIHFKFEENIAGTLVPEKVASKSATGANTSLMWPMAMFGFGLSAGAVGGYLMVDSAQISHSVKTDSGIGTAMDDMMIEPAVITESEYNQARADHNLGKILVGAGTGLLIGGLMWWLWPDDEEKPKQPADDEVKAANPAAIVPYILLPGEVLP